MSSDGWRAAPLMSDVTALAKAGIHQPLETAARLEALKRELATAIESDPKRVAALALGLEECRSGLSRQVNLALLMLADRAAELAQAEATIVELKQELARTRRQRWWPW